MCAGIEIEKGQTCITVLKRRRETMKFDTVIVGGGLAGMVSAIRLQENGQKCVVVSTGQSALHFSSGSFDLLNSLPDGEAVDHPLEMLERLDPSHPYSRIGTDLIAAYSEDFKSMMGRAGIILHGEANRNQFHFTPMGTVKRSWLMLEDFVSLDSPECLPWKRVVIVNIPGLLDFYTTFIVREFEKRGVACSVLTAQIPGVERIRENPVEMHSVNVARVFELESSLDMLVRLIRPVCASVDVVVMPAVFGLSSSRPFQFLKEQIPVPICVLPTIPPSVPGVRIHQLLVRYFIKLGGTYMLGDLVDRCDISENRVKAVYTVNNSDMPLEGEHYILATGSFFSRGIIARPDSVYEPIFGLDVRYDSDCSKLYDPNFLAAHNYTRSGVLVTSDFLALRQGKPVENLSVVGSILAGHNVLHEGCGGGVSIMSAMHVTGGLLRK